VAGVGGSAHTLTTTTKERPACMLLISTGGLDRECQHRHPIPSRPTSPAGVSESSDVLHLLPTWKLSHPAREHPAVRCRIEKPVECRAHVEAETYPATGERAFDERVNRGMRPDQARTAERAFSKEAHGSTMTQGSGESCRLPAAAQA
jgi:hypothetical protein